MWWAAESFTPVVSNVNQILDFSGAGLPGGHGLRYAAKQHSYSFTGLHQSPYEQFGKISVGRPLQQIFVHGLRMKPFFIEIPIFGAWADNLGR